MKSILGVNIRISLQDSDIFIGAKAFILNKKINFVYYLVLLLISVWILQGKENYNLDEIFSYGLSNHGCNTSISMEIPKNEKCFENPAEPFYDYMTVRKGEQFNYKNVWQNQIADVHPPLYYAILHTICSFFPEIFSVWMAGSINIVSLLVTLYFFRKILKELEINNLSQTAITIIFIFCSGIHSTISFLRMYGLTMLWVTVTLYLFLTLFKDLQNNKLLALIFLVSICGALTHYYYLIYLFFIGLLFLFYLIKYHREVITRYCITFLFSGISCIIIFPSMIRHMFLEKRGTESIQNFINFSIKNYIERCLSFYHEVNRELFANIYLLLFIACILICFYIWKRPVSKRNLRCDNNNMLWKWMFVWIPCYLYIILVVHISVYTDTRYLYPIYTILIISLYGSLFKLLQNYNKNYFYKIVISIVCIFTIIFMQVYNRTDYRYLPDLQQEIRIMYGKTPCIYIHNNSWHVQGSFNEVLNYANTTYYDEDYFTNMVRENYTNEPLIFIISSECNHKKVIESIHANYPNLKYHKQLGQFGYSNTFLFDSSQ